MSTAPGAEYTVVTDTALLGSSRPSDDGRGFSAGRTLRTLPFPDADVRVGVWRAEPGVHSHPGDAAGESFIVLSGWGTLRLEDGEEILLVPGVFVTIAPHTPSAIAVEETLLKVAVTVRP